MRATNHACVLGLALAISAGCGDAERKGPVVKTTVENRTVSAGERVVARCEVLDADGQPALDEHGEPLTDSTAFTISYQHEDSFSTSADGDVIAVRAGAGTVRCSAPDLGLIDEDPVQIEIVAGAPARVVTQAASASAVAGEPVAVGCLAFDRFNNAVTTFHRALALSPSGAGATTTSETVTATIAGDYVVSCVVDGAADVEVDFVVVVPALPSSLVVSVEPERTAYAVNDQVALVPEAHDRFGNRVDDIAFNYDATPTVTSPSEARFQFTQDGEYHLRATVNTPTDGAIPLARDQTVLVNSSGPTIECRRVDASGQASEAYMLQSGPGTLVVPVHVADVFPVQSVTIAGVPATFNASTNNYQAAVPVGFGMTFVDVIAKDQFGRENSTTCFLLVAENFTPEAAHMDNALSMRLDPAAIGDPIPGGLDSINDILSVVLGSDQLASLVDSGLVGTNPVIDGDCGVFACTPDVTYRAGTIRWDQPSSTLTLVPGGLQAQVILPNVRLTVRACGTTCCIGGTTVGVRTPSIVATVTFSLQLQGGVLRAALAGSPDIQVAPVSLDSSGFCGLLVDLLEDLFAGRARTAIQGALTAFITSNVAPLLDQLTSSLDINTLGTSFAVPRVDGTGNISLQFGLAFSLLHVDAGRALVGIGTRFTPATVAHNRPSMGVPRRTASPLIEPPGTSSSRPVGLGLYEGVLNEVLHGLWRGGFFQATLQLGIGSATIDARLPPVAAVSGSQAQLMLGGIQASIRIPGIIGDTQPLQILFGGRATASVTLSGDALHFGDLTLTQLFVSTQISLTQTQRLALGNLLTQVLQSTLANAINNGLPAFPIPTFALPPSVADFGLPPGAQLGILGPQLSTTTTHFVLTGSFGVRN